MMGLQNGQQASISHLLFDSAVSQCHSLKWVRANDAKPTFIKLFLAGPCILWGCSDGAETGGVVNR